MSVDGLHAHAPVQMVHAVRRRGDVVATAWTVVHDGAEPALTLYITGEIDLDTVDELKCKLLAHVSSAAGHVTVDLSDVAFMGADGFGLLHQLREAYGRAGVDLTLGPMSRCAQRVLAILAWSDARVRPFGRRKRDTGASRPAS
jgi:anti-anti-sigma factor